MGRVTDWILEHLPPPLRWDLTAAQVEGDEREIAAAVRTGQTIPVDGLSFDLRQLEQERHEQGWTGEDAQYPPPHLASPAATRETLSLFDGARGHTNDLVWDAHQEQERRAAMRRSIERGRAEDEARWEREGAIYERLGLAEAERRVCQEVEPDWTEEGRADPDARDEQEMDTPRDDWAELARELIDRYGAERMGEVVRRLDEMPLREVAQIREHEGMPDELRAAVDERIGRASTVAVRDFLRASEDAVDQESGITGVEGGDGDWLAYRDPEMETPIAAVDDGEGGMLQYADRPTPEVIVDTAVTRELADEVVRPSETAMAAHAIQAGASIGVEMAAEPGGFEPSGGIEPGVRR
jgi:hypothetical protein